ncbi:MAG: methyltransferase domain-containing protein [Candidatus Bathyarchaeota archaeon]|nr:methyltransferase domain-containing protein [Candidatus Bathyarchaeota archaeon]MDH5787327.1 methyltransferase domain-containing protein [Candidatus Bathyarchaeota archaeon]
MQAIDLPKGLASSNARNIAERLKSISGGKVLDVATGNGDFIRTLMKTLKDYGSFVGVDSSEKEVKSARKRLKGKSVRIMKMDAEDLQFEIDSFDTVCISYSLHHLDRVEKVLAEMKRVLKPGGHFIIQEPFRDGKQTEAQKTDILQHHWETEIDSLQGVTHHKTLAKQKILNVIRNLKLREVNIFESTHPVRCLFCSDKFRCDDPKNRQIMNESIREIDSAIDKLKKHPDLQIRTRLQEEGEKIKERIKKYGLAEASHVFFIGKK